MGTPSVPRVALYARVSTTDQDCQLQLNDLQQFVTQRGWEVVGTYIDQGISGAKASRPELNRLMQDCRNGSVNVIVTFKLDRWARSMSHLVQSMQELAKLGVRFIVTTQGLDTDQSNPMAKLLTHLLGAFAEFERSLIAERTSAGMRVARARGKQIGRIRTKDFDNTEVVRLRESGMSWRAISSALQVPVSTVRDAFQASVVCGMVGNSPLCGGEPFRTAPGGAR